MTERAKREQAERDRLASIRERLAKATERPTWNVWHVLDGGVTRFHLRGRLEMMPAERDAVQAFLQNVPEDLAWLLARCSPPTGSSAVAAPQDDPALDSAKGSKPWPGAAPLEPPRA